MATARISLVHHDPSATAATGVELLVEHGHQKARVYIDLPPPLGSHMPTTEDLIPLIRDLGEALLRISDMPSSIAF
jgi:hypothetical protein